ncbi:MAG: sulfur oxidation c-type cytochrome SoxX [Magnetococcales bacterium]|nr:sulfur oxidation c-type cytochrome SoxX [Magnetococcales bacterium]
MDRLHKAIPLALAAALLAACGNNASQDKKQKAETKPVAAKTEPVDVAVLGIAKPLTDKPGDPVNGRKLATSKKKGNCLACHDLPDVHFAGNAGPSLIESMQNNDRSVGWIRQKIVDPKVDNPDTVMFTFHSNEGKKMIRPDKVGTRVLDAQEVEDVIAYLLTLREKK